MISVLNEARDPTKFTFFSMWFIPINESPWDALCGDSVRSSSSHCRPPLVMIQLSPLCSCLPRSNLSIIEPWRLHLDQYTLKVIDIYLISNLNFLCCLLRIDASAELYQLDIFHLEHSGLERTPSALVPIVVCITWDIMLTMILIVGRYGDPTDDLNHVMRLITSSTQDEY